MSEPWRDRSFYTLPTPFCYGCAAKNVLGSRWGPWCYDCNVKRMAHLGEPSVSVPPTCDGTVYVLDGAGKCFKCGRFFDGASEEEMEKHTAQQPSSEPSDTAEAAWLIWDKNTPARDTTEYDAFLAGWAAAVRREKNEVPCFAKLLPADSAVPHTEKAEQ